MSERLASVKKDWSVIGHTALQQVGEYTSYFPSPIMINFEVFSNFNLDDL